LSEQGAPGMEAGHERTAPEAGQDGALHRGVPCLAGGAGYAPGTIVGMLAMAGGLGRWMDARGLAPGDLDRAAVTEFRDALRAAGGGGFLALTAWTGCWSTWKSWASSAGAPRQGHQSRCWLSVIAGGW
jgi:hypothetical protein